jgi:transcriptional regulator GlxA family with amidase domain
MAPRFGIKDNMTAIPAKTKPAPQPAGRQVVILAYQGVNLLDVAGPAQVFTSATALARDGGPPPYGVSVVAKPGGATPTSTGVAIVAGALDEVAAQPIDTLIVAGGPGIQALRRDPEVVAWLAARAAGARRTCSVCTGAFLLAAAGLLDGRRATTHWRHAGALQSAYPKVRVEPDPIWVQDGALWTSAGVSAGIDLALALVEADLGHAVALEVARHLVVFLKRPGSQAQFSAALAGQAAGNGRFGELHAWIAANLERDLRVERLAERAAMSPRNFARAYAAATGVTPAKAVEAQRVEAARRLLEETARPLGWVARAAGFGDDERMRRSFVRWIGVAPSDYRDRFRTGGPERRPAERAGAGERHA